jgi:hypothetical protein
LKETTMSGSDAGQSKGRRDNAATPPGTKPGLVPDDGVKRTGRKARRSAGPDGPDAKVVGEVFKHRPKSA